MSHALPTVPLTVITWTCIVGVVVLQTTLFKSFKSVQHEHVGSMEERVEELAKGKHVFEPALQWSAVLLNRTKARQNVPLTHVENQTPI